MNASIGQIFYFRDREVRLKAIDPALDESLSATAVEVNWLPDEVWNLRSSLLYDTSDNQFDAASIQLGSNPAKVVFSTLGHPARTPALC